MCQVPGGMSLGMSGATFYLVVLDRQCHILSVIKAQKLYVFSIVRHILYFSSISLSRLLLNNLVAKTVVRRHILD